MKKQLLLLVLMGSFVMTYAQQPLSPSPSSNQISQVVPGAQFPKTNANERLSYKIIDAPGNTYGYDVYAKSRIMIHQVSIPGLTGNEGFKTKDGAIKIALLVMDKIKKGEMPPTISLQDLHCRQSGTKN